MSISSKPVRGRVQPSVQATCPTVEPRQNVSASDCLALDEPAPESAVCRGRTTTNLDPVDERAKALSRLYEEVKAQVKVLVDQADPEGLLGMGAPLDEYDDAVTELTRHVLKHEPVNQKAVEQWFDRVYGAAPARAGALVAELERLRVEAQNGCS
jgi:hypothetical protein